MLGGGDRTDEFGVSLDWLPIRGRTRYNAAYSILLAGRETMTDTSNAHPLPESHDSDAQPGEFEQVRWEVVEQTSGITPAEIIAGRLQAEGIPARAWQEGAGEALGLMVGLLGMGHVAVPEEFAEQARAILAADAAAFAAEEEE